MKTVQVMNETVKNEQPQKPQTKSNILSKIKQKILEIINPTVKNLGHLTYIEVLGLMKAEEGLDLYPLDMYQGLIKGAIYYKKKVPSMKRLKHANYGSRINDDNFDRKDQKRREELHMGKKMIEKVSGRGYIMDDEIKMLEKLGFKLIMEDIPAVFIIAPKTVKELQNVETTVREILKDPIILVKHGENDFEPVHSWDNSQALNDRLIKLN